MPYSVESLLGWRHLTNTVNVVKSGIPQVVPSQFFSIKETVPADKARYVETLGQRKLARKVPYGSPGKQAGKLSLNQRDVNLMAFGEVMPFDNELFTIFRKWDEYAPQQKFAMNQLEYQGEGFRALFDNARYATLHSFLAFGACYFDTDGNLLDSSSGADLTVTQDIPAVNTGTVTDVDGSTQIVTASWATATTNIVEQIRNLKALALKRTGEPLKYAFYGKNIAGYVAKNDFAKSYWPFAKNGEYALQIQHAGKVPEGFMELEWIPMQDAFYVKSDDSYATPFPADQITFFPEINRDTYTLFEGTTMVPSQYGVYGDAKSALNSLKEVTGMGRFAYVEIGGATKIMDVAFDLHLSRFKKPSSVFILDSTP